MWGPASPPVDVAAVALLSAVAIVANLRCPHHRSWPLTTSLPTMFAENIISVSRPPVRPPNGTRTNTVPHPSQEGKAYAPEVRDQVISIWQNGGDLRSPMLDQLPQQRKFPHIVTCGRWIAQFNEEGHTRCKRPTGNRISQREVHGQDLFNLSLHRMVRPKGYLDEVGPRFTGRNGGSDWFARLHQPPLTVPTLRQISSSASSTSMLNFQMAYKERAQGTSSILMRVIINWRRKIGSLGR